MKLFCLLAPFLVSMIGWAQPKPNSTEQKQVAVFLSCECPISQKYIPILNELYREYGSKTELQWKFIITGDVSRKELKAFVREFEVNFPIQREDGKQTFTRLFNATVTPQVIIMGNEVLYS